VKTSVKTSATKGLIIFAVFLAVACYGALIFFSEGIIFPSPGIALALSLMTLADYFIRSVRWKLLLRHYGMKVGVFEAFKTFISGLMFSLTPLKAGEVVKAELMNKRHGFGRKPVAFIIVLERVFDMLALTLIGGFTAFFVAKAYTKSVWIFFGAMVLGAAALYFLRKRLLFIKDELEKLKNLRVILQSILLSVVAWGLECLELWLAVSHFGGVVSIPQAAFAFSASVVLGTLSMLPGGLGASEASAVGLLILFSVGKSAATSATLLARLTTLWLGFFAGAIFWFLSYKKNLKSSDIYRHGKNPGTH
jgi:uncharacterized membrane protein YbhN (UPF0104 family)